MLWSALLLGFLGSAHCIVMCGPIAAMVPGSKGKNRITAALLYNSGKLLSYIIIGLFFGIFTAFITSFKIQSIIMISGGLIISIFAFTPAILSLIEKQGLKTLNSVFSLKAKMSQSLDKNRLEFGFYIGFLNGFIPCGLVYVAAIAAINQPSPVDTALYMLFFGLGTLPVLSAIIITSSFVKEKLSTYASKIKFAGLFIVGCFMIWKGISNYHTDLKEPTTSDTVNVCH